jgi:hypothetical protein
MKITEIRLNDDNPRLIFGDRMQKLMNSIEQFPKMMKLRPIVVDENGVIIGGNMRYRALVKLGYKDIPDEWVKRADELTEDEKQEFIIKDNVQFGDWEMDELANEWDADILDDWGYEIPNWGDAEEELDNIYTRKIEAPIYEPSDQKPAIAKLIDRSKTDDLIKEIDQAKIPTDLKEFLHIASYRHTVFDYGKIADYYSHSSAEVKALMEKSALVIIDFNKAIENGFIELTSQLNSLFENDYEDEE